MAKILMQRNEARKPCYYQYCNGRRPIFGAKGDAVRLDVPTAEKVLAQLTTLGFPNIKMMDEGARPE